MFKKFINDTAKNLKSEFVSDFKELVNDTKEEFGVRNKKDLQNVIDKSKDSIKQGLQENELKQNELSAIVDLSIGKVGLSQREKDYVYNKPTEGINKVINKIQNIIPEGSLFKNEQSEKIISAQPILNTLIVNEQPIPKEKFVNIEKKQEPNMISENLNSLIEFALADGELSEKEKQILFKKAEIEGIDLDEFEIILEAKLFNAKQTQEPPKQVPNVNVAPKSDKFGDIKKCPSCGAIVESFSTRCTDCGHSFTNIQANASVQKLFDMINELESKRGDDETNPLKAFGSAISKSFGVSVGDRINNQKKELISNFPVPNTKDDIIEFLTLALPKARKAGNFFTSGTFNTPANDRNKIHNEFVSVWKNKCEQIIMKARFSMKEDKKTLQEIEYYSQQLGIK
jgi:hypothetical protein